LGKDAKDMLRRGGLRLEFGKGRKRETFEKVYLWAFS